MLDTAIVALVVVYVLKGFFSGDTREMKGLVAIAISYGVAHIPGDDIARDLASAGLTAEFSKVTALSITTATVYPGVFLLISLIGQEFNYFGNRVSLAKRLLGSAIAGTKAITVCVLLVNVLVRLPLDSSTIRDSKWVQAMNTSNSELPDVENFDSTTPPLQRFP